MNVAPEPVVLSEALHCPLCGYDLRATTEPRCPECGYAFDLGELRDPERRLHPYAFEHHPERNASSFLQTLFAGLRPHRFWRKMHPTQPSRPRRLLLYWAIVVLPCVVLLAAQAARTIVSLDRQQVAQAKAMATRAPQVYDQVTLAGFVSKYGSLQAWADASTPRWPHPWFRRWVAHSYLVREIAIGTIAWLAWPWVTLAGLMIFQASMRRARVRPIHVLRCVFYAGDVALWWAIGAAAVVAIDIYRNGMGAQTWAQARSTPIHWLMVAGLLVATWRLAAAYRHYLRFPHAWATALAVQFMVALLLFKLVLDWEYFF
jgi:hypothetical protein